jgi:type II secretion system protein G
MKKKGFTLIELMIVIAIIAILAAILVPNFLRARAQGQYTACQSNLKNIGTALEMYSVDNGGRYPNATQVTTNLIFTPTYLSKFPDCPSAGANTYSGSYVQATTPAHAYTFYCNGAYHTTFAPTGYPRYTSKDGLILK